MVSGVAAPIFGEKQNKKKTGFHPKKPGFEPKKKQEIKDKCDKNLHILPKKLCKGKKKPKIWLARH
jgi:hypothetical protein